MLASPPSAIAPRAPSAVPPMPFVGDLLTGWQRVVDEVMRKKPMLGAVLTQAHPTTIVDGELTVTLVGNNFHREMLADRANHDIVTQAVKRNLNADRLTVAADPENSGSPTAHPAVQAAIAEFEGEVVAVRPRAREGEGQ
jgi:hypothetical protein